MRRRHGLMVGLGVVGALLAPRAAFAGLPDCEPGTVIRAAPPDRKPILLRAFSFYAYYPDYSQGACLNVATGQKQGTNFNAYYGGCDAKDWWRTDCSGFVSSAWDLSKNYVCGDLANGGSDSAGHSWHGVGYPELIPGDAINDPAEHVMLFTGWLTDDHSKVCTVQELNPTQADPDGVVGCGIWSWTTSDLEGTYNPLQLDDTGRLNPTPSQPTSNDSLSLVNWPDGHAEAFLRGTDGKLYHSWNSGGSWNAPEALDSSVDCGSTVAYWPHLPKWDTAAEVFSPRAGSGVGHLWWSKGNWNTFQALGTQTMAHLSSVFDFDANLAVFALGADGAIYENYGDRWAGKWSDWQSLGGTFSTGAGAIVWNDGHIELFATDTQGNPEHDWTDASTGKWAGWQPMVGKIASRPMPVRWADGHVEVFATGLDGHLQSSHFDGKQWTPFVELDTTTSIAGEPSPVMNVNGGGGGAGPEVFARTTDGTVVHLWWTGSGYNTFTPLATQTTASDPFAWLEKDGSVEVFAVDGQGTLTHTHRTTSGWSAWTPIGGGVDACPLPPPPPDEGLGGAATTPAGLGGAAAGPGGAGGSATHSGPTNGDTPGASAGCACTVGSEGAGQTGVAALLGALAAVLTARRKGRKS